MPESFDPYHRWLGIPPKDQPPTPYRLLALNLWESDPEVIQDAAIQRISHVRTYQLGPHSAISQQILNELAAAKVCLLDPQKKAAYDAMLRRQQALSALPPLLSPLPASCRHLVLPRLLPAPRHGSHHSSRRSTGAPCSPQGERR